MTRRAADVHGFETVPDRPPWATIVLLVVVVTAAATFADVFREAAFWTIDRYAGTSDPTQAATSLPAAVVTALIVTVVAASVAIAQAVLRRWPHRVGLEAVAASARGEDRRLSLRSTLSRSAATWLLASGLASIGRESAIIETGGAIGSVTGRRSGGRGAALAAAGIAAAFAAAYHAPIAAALYVEEHLGVRRSRRALLFTVAGAIGGHLVAVGLLGGDEVFPRTQGSRLDLLALTALCLLPTVLAARFFLQLRNRVTGIAVAVRRRRHRWIAIAVASLFAGAVVAASAMTAGNGMEGLRQASTDATVGLAVALAVGKLAGTAATLAAGAPGGVLSPTMAIAAGWALLTLLGAEQLGLDVSHPWDVVVAAMAVGVAVGLRSPLVAVFLIPEMLGELSLLPVVAAVVGAAVVVDRGIDRFAVGRGGVLPVGVRDEDA